MSCRNIKSLLDGYLPLTGGEKNAITGDVYLNRSFFKIANTSEYGSIHFYPKKETYYGSGTSFISFTDDQANRAIYAGADNNEAIDFGLSYRRWKNVYSKNGNFSGDLAVSGSINGLTKSDFDKLKGLVNN